MLEGGEAEVDGSVSSRFLTSVLLAAPLAQRPVTLSVRGKLVSEPYIDITLDLVARFGAEVRHAVHQRYEVANGDHRMAMCFSQAALGGIPVTIQNPNCVGKTFPDYFDKFTALIDG